MKKENECQKSTKNKKTYEFPDGGWECSKCHNYNFKGRNECHRCRKPKTIRDQSTKPNHMFQSEQEKAQHKTEKQRQRKHKKIRKMKEKKVIE